MGKLELGTKETVNIVKMGSLSKRVKQTGLELLFKFISYKWQQEDKLGPHGDHQDN